MLCHSLKEGDSFFIGDTEVRVLSKTRVRLGIVGSAKIIWKHKDGRPKTGSPTERHGALRIKEEVTGTH